MRGIISNLFKIPSVSNAISKDLQRLQAVERGLGDKAVAYVMKDKGGTVLATLANVDAAKILGLDSNYSNAPGDKARGTFLAQQAQDTAVLARYGEVLAAALGGEKDYLAGTKHVPLSLRILFTKAGGGLVKSINSWPRKLVDASACVLTPEFSVEICEAAGGSAADLFDILYNDDGRWRTSNDICRLTDLFDFAPVAHSHTPDLLVAGRRMGAGGKVNLIKKMRKWKMFGDPDARAYLIDMSADGAKSVRNEAVQSMRTLPEEQILRIAKEKLDSGTAPIRAAMVELLAGMRSEAGVDLLRDHLASEKTARIKAAIESTLTVEDVTQADNEEEGDDSSYLALDGSRVDIPPRIPFRQSPRSYLGWKTKRN